MKGSTLGENEWSVRMGRITLRLTEFCVLASTLAVALPLRACVHRYLPSPSPGHPRRRLAIEGLRASHSAFGGRMTRVTRARKTSASGTQDEQSLGSMAGSSGAAMEPRIELFFKTELELRERLRLLASEGESRRREGTRALRAILNSATSP